MEKILSGKPVSQFIVGKILSLDLRNIVPRMVILVIGADPASKYYAHSIAKQGSKLDFDIVVKELSDRISTDELMSIIVELNNDNKVHGIMIQKPLPRVISDAVINSTINPKKDIDGIHPINLGRLFMSMEGFTPATAKAVVELIKFYNIETSGKHVVILGRSTVVAKPLAGFLLQKNQQGNATVSICHSYTQDLMSVTQTGDIIISAIGKPNFVKSEMIKKNAVCIDVGINLINHSEQGNVYVGDFDYNSCFDKSLSITPVPGGIGSITTSILLDNLTKAALQQSSDKNS